MKSKKTTYPETITTDPHVGRDSPVALTNLGRSKLAQKIMRMVLQREDEESELRKYKFVAVRTRQSIISKGIDQTIRDAVTTKPSDAFIYLVGKDRPEDTYEWMCLEEPRFSDLHEKAAKRLRSYGVTGYPGWTRSTPMPAISKPRAARLELTE